MGIQGHSTEGLRLITEWIADGAIGEVREVDAWCSLAYYPWGHASWSSKWGRRPAETPRHPPAHSPVRGVGNRDLPDAILIPQRENKQPQQLLPPEQRRGLGERDDLFRRQERQAGDLGQLLGQHILRQAGGLEHGRHTPWRDRRDAARMRS